MYNLLPLNVLKYQFELDKVDSAYIISRFCEEFEKNMFDEFLSKIPISGYYPSIDEYDYFDKLRSKVNDYIDIFYNGDKLSKFEREIERAYLVLKNNTSLEQISSELNKQKTRINCILTQSDMNKIAGLLNFRMNNLNYMEFSSPKFERIDPEYMFNTLYLIRSSTLSRYSIKDFINKMKLDYQYRQSLIRLGSDYRVKMSGKYLLSQIIIYTTCKEFNDEFNLNINYKIALNFQIALTWLVVQRLEVISKNNDNFTKACNTLISTIKENLVTHIEQQILVFDSLRLKGKRIKNVNKLIDKAFQSLNFNFNMLGKINKAVYLTSNLFLNEFLETGKNEHLLEFNDLFTETDDVLINKLYKVYYPNHIAEFFISLHDHINSKDYFDIEQGDLNFNISHMKIPFIYNQQMLQEKDFILSLNNNPKAILNYNLFVEELIKYHNIQNLPNNVNEFTYNVHDSDCYSTQDINKLPLKQRLSMKYQQEWIFSNEIEEEERKYEQKQKEMSLMGKELQYRSRDKIGLNELIVYQKKY